MSLLEVKQEFTRRELLWFGPLFALFVGLIALLLTGKFQWYSAAYVLCGCGGVLILLYYLVPSIRVPIYRGWIYSVLPLGWVISHCVLAAIYILLVTPIGMIMRLVRYDPLQRKFDRQASTYWSAREPTANTDRYFKQY